MSRHDHESSDWRHEDSVEHFICPFCYRDDEIVVVSIAYDAEQKKGNVSSKIQCVKCDATGAFRCKATQSGRVYEVEWYDAESDQSSPGNVESHDSSTFVREPEAVEACRSLARKVQYQLESTERILEEEAKLAQKLLEHQTEDSRLHESLQKRIQVTRSTLDDEVDQLQSMTTRSLERLKARTTMNVEEISKEIKDFTNQVQFELSVNHHTQLDSAIEGVTDRVRKATAGLDTIQKYVRRVHALVASTAKDVVDLGETLQQLLTDAEGVKNEETVLRLISDEFMERVISDSIRRTLSPMNLRSIVTEYHREAEQRIGDPASIVRELPELFDVIEERLISWKKPDKVVKSTNVREEVSKVLHDIWKRVVYWQQCRGIVRFPNINEAYDERLHRLSGSHVVSVNELPDTVSEIARSGYYFGDDQALLRKAEVIANVKPRKHDS